MNHKNAIRIFITLSVSIIAMGINYLIMWFLTPFITEHMGVEAYGFVSLTKTISNYGILITGCLNAYAARYISVSYHKERLDQAKEYISSVYFANLFLLFVVLIFEIFFIWKINLFIKIPDTLLFDVRVLFAVEIFNYMLAALVSTFSVSCYIVNRLDWMDLIRAISYIVEIIVLVLLFSYCGLHIYYVGIGLLVSTIVLGVGYYIFSRKYTNDLKISRDFISLSAIKELFLSGIWNTINNAGNLLNSGLDLLVSNILLSNVAMGELAVVKTVSTILSSLSQILSKPFQPHLLKRYANSDVDGIVNILNLQIKFSGFFGCVGVAGLICLGRSYYKLWVPNQNSNLLYELTIITVIGFLFECVAQPLFYVYNLTLQNKIPCIVTVISGFLNVIGMYVLIAFYHLDLYAVVGTTTVLSFFNFILFTPKYSFYCLGKQARHIYLTIVRVFLAAITIAFIEFNMFRNVNIFTWWQLFLFALLVTIVSIPIYLFFVIGKREISYICSRIHLNR